MPFSEALKTKVRKRALNKCCICHSFPVEVHHIIPQVEGGADTEDNAAPLCPSCHVKYGANPQMRKQIQEARDAWYEKCAKPFEVSSIPKEIADTLQNLASKEDIERLAVRNVSYVLGSSEGGMPSSLEQSRYSFCREEFVNPLIIRELLGGVIS